MISAMRRMALDLLTSLTSSSMRTPPRFHVRLSMTGCRRCATVKKTSVENLKKVIPRRGARMRKQGGKMSFCSAAQSQTVQVSSVIPSRRVSEGSGYKVDLTHISAGTSAGFARDHRADILCLDLQDFGVERAIEWVRQVQHLELEHGTPLTIVLFGREGTLSKTDLWRISQQAELFNASFRTYAAEESFETAFRRYADIMSKGYESFRMFDDEAAEERTAFDRYAILR